MSQRIQPMSADSAKAIIDSIKGNLASIAVKSADGLTRYEAIALEDFCYASKFAHSRVVEGNANPSIKLPAEELGAKNQSDWEGQRLATKLSWRDTAMAIGEKQPDTFKGIPSS